MPFVADLHVHSYLSRATSKKCNLEGLHEHAQLKGVRVVGTGDFTHPAWFAELEEKLEPASPGLFRLRHDSADPVDSVVPASCKAPADFMLTGEISSIYKRDGRVRKIHSLILVPDLETARKVNARLDAIGNIKSDGRPILGLDPRDLLEIVLEANPDAYLIPAHIWTPWFSMLGSKSGFDSLEECFGELSRHIFAVETGLSSDAPMNMRVSGLDGLTLVSNSDLHSPGKLARNANIFHCEVGFPAIRDALRSKDPASCGGTIDLFPEEGKYHMDGHRKCDVCLEPEESLARDCLCPVCGKPLVLGVRHRVVSLADRPKGTGPDNALPYEYIIPLDEILAEIFDCGPGTKKVRRAYDSLLRDVGPELAILREVDPERLDRKTPTLLGEAVRRLRNGRVIRKPGYDGEYGEIRVFGPGEKDELRRQAVLFSASVGRTAARATPGPAAPREVREQRDPDYTLGPLRRRPAAEAGDAPAGPPVQPALFPSLAFDFLDDLGPRQREAATDLRGPVLIVAGPGTGKTRTLTHRIAWLVRERHATPDEILAVTFTTRAAGEMRDRLSDLLPGDTAGRLRIGTFHALGLGILREHAEQAGLPPGFGVVDQDEAARLLQSHSGLKRKQAKERIEAVGQARRCMGDANSVEGGADVEQALTAAGVVDLDSIIPRTVELLRQLPEVADRLNVAWLCIDEYQDINRAQYELVRLLSPEGKGVCAIGDPDQAIYGFRGSDVSFFLRFQEDFPGAGVHTLTRNFRSDSFIVETASRVISPGRSAVSAAAESAFTESMKVRFHEALTAAAEAEFITHEVEKWLGGVGMFSVDSDRVSGEDDGSVSFADIVVLVRLHALVQPLTDALTRLGLPVQTVGGKDAFETAEMRKVVQTLRGLPSRLLDLRASEVLTEDAGSELADVEPLRATAEWQRLGALARGADDTLRQLLDRVGLRQVSDAYDDAAEQVTIMTLHAAKGLEFPIVFLAACEDGILPYVRPGDDEPDLEEERRLLYVGITRAQRVLYLSHARKRTLFGTSSKQSPSRFLDEIDAALRDVMDTSDGRKRKPRGKQLEFDFE